MTYGCESIGETGTSSGAAKREADHRAALRYILLKLLLIASPMTLDVGGKMIHTTRFTTLAHSRGSVKLQQLSHPNVESNL